MTYDELRDENSGEPGYVPPLDDAMLEAASAYNVPSAVPRDVMWERIQARRAAASGLGPRASGHTRRRGWVIALGSVGALAATLLLGVMIGRQWQTGGAASPATTVASTSPVTSPTTTSSSAADSMTATPPTVVAVAPSSGQATQGSTRVPSTPAQDRRGAQPRRDDPTLRAVASIMESRGASVPNAALRSAGADPQLYQLVALQHLSRTEALLVAYRAEAAQGSFDARISRWARDLLSTTRLLIDSPAASDPQMKQLLGDLETILARLASLSAQKAGQDARIIDDALSQGDMLHRLRIAAEVQGE